MNGKQLFSAATAVFFAVTMAACGGGEQAGQAGGEQAGGQQQAEGAAEAEAELTMPDWMTVDEANQTVEITLIAGETDANNSWNYNGYHSGNATIVVPQGYEVTLTMENNDQVNPHSVGIDSQIGGYPPTYSEVSPVFEGAVTSGATKMASATQPGESETITFTASEAGEYAAVCYVPAHAAQGMWIGFDVSAEGEAGLRTSS